MESLHHLLVVFAAYVIAAGSPGPSTLRIMGVAMNHGRRAGLTLAAGVVSGSLFWGLSAATGVSALMTRYAEALLALKIAGALYLLYLAFKAARSALTKDTAASAPIQESDAAPSPSALLPSGIDHAPRKSESGSGLDRARYARSRRRVVVA